jgi:phosphatidylserine/phosphatidylglycerophosphate/cardiolipin synthase-like enzyme
MVAPPGEGPMRFKSPKTAVGQVFAVSGTNTISFAIAASEQTKKGLLGFAVERSDPAEGERDFMWGFKVFEKLIPDPAPDLQVRTDQHPVQSFSWDDFTAKPGRTYEYFFHPVKEDAQHKGDPRHLDRSSPAVAIKVRTEDLYSAGEHDIFFNRGVASSQAYARRFGNSKPDNLPEPKRSEALDWLGRELDDAMLRFISGAKQDDTLLCCFYEFRYRPVVDALAAAIGRGVKARIIIDAKVNEYTDKKGNFHESFPRKENLATIQAAGIPDANILRREARASAIQHNKFMVLLRGAQADPAEVWTGSTNISQGGIFGQTNVGHWVRNRAVAASFADYWGILAGDPGGTRNDAGGAVRKKNAALRDAVAKLTPRPAGIAGVPAGTTTLFSPRAGTDVLDLYVSMLDDATNLSCITLAFGINKAFKDQLKDNTPQSHLTFMLLEKEDKPAKNSKQPFISINASHNVYKAWGSYIEDSVYQWAKETNTRLLDFNRHVMYIHSKFLLRDPLGSDPIVVTGSANFSEPSTDENDENMLVIRGDLRVADIYFTEFNRLFNHYYFRSVVENLKDGGRKDQQESLFLDDTPGWQDKYQKGKLKAKRLAVYTRMAGFTAL